MHTRKKIVFAINNLGMGGAENMLVEQVRCVDRDLFDPYVITLLKNQKVNVIDKLPKDIKFIQFDFTSIFSLYALYKLWAFLRREKIDAIITNLFDTNLLGRVAAILARVPVIISYELNVDVIHKLQKQYELDIVTPLYTMNEARQSLGFIDGYPFNFPVTIGENTTVKFYVAGHILGSAFSVVTIKRDDKIFKILYTGDVGRFGKPILKDPTLTFDEEDRDIDLFITESTYGDREHEPVEDLGSRLKKVLNDTFERGGSVIIPSFAFGRTQELIYILHELYDKKEGPRHPIYVDSPLASNLTKVFGEHPETYDKETHQTFLEKGKNPFQFDKIKFVQTVEESMRLTQDSSSSHVVISASGMCEAGRILHHLRYRVHDSKNTILLVGYMAENTLGRRIQDLGAQSLDSGENGEVPEIKILGKTYPLHAKVEKIGGFSAHADKHELEKIISKSNLRIKKIGIVHGEESQSAAFAKHLKQKGYETIIPKPGDKISL